MNKSKWQLFSAKQMPILKIKNGGINPPLFFAFNYYNDHSPQPHFTFRLWPFTLHLTNLF